MRHRRWKLLCTLTWTFLVQCSAQLSVSNTIDSTDGTNNHLRGRQHNPHVHTTRLAERSATAAQQIQRKADGHQGSDYPHSQAQAAKNNGVVEDWYSETNKDHWKERQSTDTASGVYPDNPPQLELVVTRANEKLEWISKVPQMWHITILNRGSKESRWSRGSKYHNITVVNMPSKTSDSELLASYMVDRYYSLAEYTVFSPAKPLHFNWRFLDLLATPTKFGTVQALAGQSFQKGSKIVTDRISTRTLNSVLIHDPQSVQMAKWFAKDYNLTWGQNLVKRYFDMIGLKNWMDERQEVGSHALGAMVGFERSRATRHSKQIYESLLQSIPVFGGNHNVVEKLWIMLLGGSDFRDVPL